MGHKTAKGSGKSIKKKSDPKPQKNSTKKERVHQVAPAETPPAPVLAIGVSDPNALVTARREADAAEAGVGRTDLVIPLKRKLMGKSGLAIQQ